MLLFFIKITIMIQWEKALKWEEESFSLLPSLPCFPLITTNNPLLSTLCVCVSGSPVVRPSGLGPGRKTSLVCVRPGFNAVSIRLRGELHPFCSPSRYLCSSTRIPTVPSRSRHRPLLRHSCFQPWLFLHR